eukprot:TRINITY_DN2619_c0_g1_i2.p1 TRINITY_DN2619_c0_g1~~TRINITY_DN2619_c0_g1_i2.p1  ORF type:complete len:444 (-),score=50.52 TRINITY_DN2619_c0_g1_i2:742-2073(-)
MEELYLNSMTIGLCPNATNYTLYGAPVYPVLFACALLSIGGTLLILLSYCVAPSLRVHPLTIIFRISLFQLISTLALSIGYILAYLKVRFPNSNYNDNLGFTIGDTLTQLVATMGNFASLLFHCLLSVNLIMSTFRPFADSSSLAIFYKPIYAFSILYPICRVTLWRVLWYGVQLGCPLTPESFFRKSEYPYEAAVGISLIFLIAVVAVAASAYGIQSLPPLLYSCKKSIITQNLLYLSAYLICWTGPLIWRTGTALVHYDLRSNLNLRAWSDFSELLVGFLTSLVWISFPSIRNVVLSSCDRSNRDVVLLPLIQKAEESIDLVLRKNFLIAILNGLRVILKGDPSSDDEELEPVHYTTEPFRKHYISPEDTNKDFVPGSLEITCLYPKAFKHIRRLSKFSDEEFYVRFEDVTCYISTSMELSMRIFYQSSLNWFVWICFNFF